ncbi:PP2C family protein-serine/threonine phosphatase [Propionivibrio sp.]|uniref:PP2C family protein-serine/threonine phosphatase n=1 Tax=Propionivibrio sp. TaxID=2212460 RepID=UPI003BF28FFF
MTIEHAKQLVDSGANPRLTGDMEMLLAISQDFVGTPAMSETLANAIRQIMVYMDTEAASIFLLDAANEKLTCLACAGPVSIEGLTIARNQGIVGRALSDNCVQMVRDVSADGDFSTAVDDSTGFTTRSILCAPLVVKGRMLGALEVINKRKGDGLFDLADKQFLQVLAGMVSLAVHNAQMTEALVEQERMRRELDLAREIQRDLLPDLPAVDFPVQGLNLSAMEVSGDFYDFFTLADGRIAWGLGDVSGKGMNAAMLMAKTISLFRCLGKTVHDSALLLAMLNDEIVETASRGMFVTMAAGIFDPVSGEVVFANAGHQPPLYRTPEGVYCELEESSPPLGIVPGMEYTEQSLILDGGRLYIFTDGVTEGRAEDGKMLELGGLQALLDKHAALPPIAQLTHVAEALVRPGIRLHDDLTLLVIG